MRKIIRMRNCSKCNKIADTKRGYCRRCKNDYDKNKYYTSKLGYYLVYYLPHEHYVGITEIEPRRRMQTHKRDGRDTTDWKVLFCSKDRNEAYYHEAMFHAVLGINGLTMK